MFHLSDRFVVVVDLFCFLVFVFSVLVFRSHYAGRTLSSGKGLQLACMKNLGLLITAPQPQEGLISCLKGTFSFFFILWLVVPTTLDKAHTTFQPERENWFGKTF